MAGVDSSTSSGRDGLIRCTCGEFVTQEFADQLPGDDRPVDVCLSCDEETALREIAAAALGEQ